MRSVTPRTVAAHGGRRNRPPVKWRFQPVNATPGGLDGLDSSWSRASAGVPS